MNSELKKCLQLLLVLGIATLLLLMLWSDIAVTKVKASLPWNQEFRENRSNDFNQNGTSTQRNSIKPLNIIAYYGNTKNKEGHNNPPLLSMTMDNITAIANTYYNDSAGFPTQWPVRPSILAFSKLLQFDKLSLADIAMTVSEPMKLSSDQCDLLYHQSMLPKYVHPRVYGKCSGYEETDITLLIQIDRNRTDYLKKLTEMAHKWRGPISTVIYYGFVNASSIPSWIYFARDIKKLFDEFNLHGSTVCVHIAYMKKMSPVFPINFLRNMAMEFAQTDTVLLSEGDFIPEPDLDKLIKKHLTREKLRLKRLYIVPIFATNDRKYRIPDNKSELISQWDAHHTVPIITVKKHFPFGHRPVNYARFKTATQVYEVKYARAFEPYYVVNRTLVPYYPEEFVWGYSDKHIHAKLLNATGWKFFVLPDAFMVHTPHSKQARRRDGKYHRCSREIAGYLQTAIVKCANLTQTLDKK